MTSFFITPYKPPDDITQWTAEHRTSDLLINPDEYKMLLLDQWPGIKFYTSRLFALQWGFLVSAQGAQIIASLHKDQHTISVDTPYEEYFLWHRSVIRSNYRLFLYNNSNWKSTELTSQTTLEELRRFLGGHS